MSHEVWYADALTEANKQIIGQENAHSTEIEMDIVKSLPILEALIKIGHQPTTLLRELNRGIRFMHLYTPYSQSVGEMTEEDIRHLQYNWGEASGLEEKRKEKIIEICSSPRWSLLSPHIANGNLCLHGFEIFEQYAIVVEITRDGQKFKVAISDGKKPEIEIEERTGLFGLNRKITELPVPILEERVSWKETRSLDSEELKPLLVEATKKTPLNKIYHQVPWDRRAEFGIDTGYGGASWGSWGGWST